MIKCRPLLYKSLLFAALRMSSTLTTATSSPRILSIQSTVAHGYVGNRAALFPLQSMGFNVDSINTVSLSNHPNYTGGFKGQFMSVDEMSATFDGLKSNDLCHYDIVMNGYTRSADLLECIGDIVANVKEQNHQALYICDPVLGDNDRYYVPEQLLEIYKTKMLPLAYAVTPNYFELEALTGMSVNCLDDAITACDILHKEYNISLCILTGQRINNNSNNDSNSSTTTETVTATSNGVTTTMTKNLSIIVSARIADEEPTILRLNVPTFPGYFYGCGDLFSALFAAGLYRSCQLHNLDLRDREKERTGTVTQNIAKILDQSAWAMHNVLKQTSEANSKELKIIESIDIYRHLYRDWIPSKATTSTTRTNTGISDKSSNDGGDDIHNLVGANLYFSPPSMDLFTSTIESLESHHGNSFVVSGKCVGVICDMDGTLTEPGAIDFTAMYSRAGVTREGGDILSQVKLMNQEDKERAMRVIHEEEEYGNQRMQLRPDLMQFIARLKAQRIRIGLSTRNSDIALQHFLKESGLHESTFQTRLHRDSLGDVNKPDPRVAYHILNEWDVSYSTVDSTEGAESTVESSESNIVDYGSSVGYVWFLGDSIDDMKCGRLAGCKTCLLKTPFNVGLEGDKEWVDMAVDKLTDFTDNMGL